MKVKVLGSAASGGLPQWNCNCQNCASIRQGKTNIKPRTKASIAITMDSENWVVINVSPDIRTQLVATPELQPGRSIRDTGIVGIILTDSQLEHVAGLLQLREGNCLEVFSTKRVQKDLTEGFPIFNLLDKYCKINMNVIDMFELETFSIADAEGLTFRAMPIINKPPNYSSNRYSPMEGDSIAIGIEDKYSGKKLLYAPNFSDPNENVKQYMEQADCVLIDGSCWVEEDNNLQKGAVIQETEANHLQQSGDDGLMSLVRYMHKPRKILTHISHTNPILDESSPEYQALQKEQIELAWDGMEIIL